MNGSGSSDPDGDALTFTWSGPFGAASGATPIVLLPLGNNLVTLTVTDTAGATATATVGVKVQDTTPPTINVPTPIMVEATGVNGATVNYTVSAVDLVDGAVAVSCDHASGATFPLGSSLVTCTAKDVHNNTGTATFTVTVQDTIPPVVMSLEANPNPVMVNAPVTLTALAGDPQVGGSRIAGAQFTLDEVNYVAMQAQDGTFDSFSEQVVAILPVFTTPGVYTIRVRAWDEAGNLGESTEFLFLAVYDPTGGFVTGGGWINSPAGAFNPGLEEFAGVVGKATFGFVSKYQKGANVPSGNTEFQFKAGRPELQEHGLRVAGGGRGPGPIQGLGHHQWRRQLRLHPHGH